MVSKGTVALPLLLVACLAAFLFYTIAPQGTQLLWTSPSVDDIRMPVSTEMTGRADRFTPE